MKKLKNILNNIFASLLVGVCVIFAIPLLIIYGLYLPIALIRYYRSPYYKDQKKKFTVAFALSDVIRLYNRIKKENLPITYAANGDFEYFIKDDTVLLLEWPFEYFDEIDGEWRFYCDGTDDPDMSDKSENPAEIKDTEPEDETVAMEDILAESREKLKEEHRDLPIRFVCLDGGNHDEGFEKALQCPYMACFKDFKSIGKDVAT